MNPGPGHHDPRGLLRACDVAGRARAARAQHRALPACTGRTMVPGFTNDPGALLMD